MENNEKENLEDKKEQVQEPVKPQTDEQQNINPAAKYIREAKEQKIKTNNSMPHMDGISTKKPRSSLYRFTLITGLIMAVLLFGVGVGVFLAPDQLNITDNRADETANPADQVEETPDPEDTSVYIELDEPTQNQSVDGQFTVSGKVESSVDVIIIEVLDIDGLILGKEEFEVPTVGTQRIKEFEKEVTLTGVPRNPIGTVNVYPKATPKSLDSIPVNFDLPNIVDKIEINSIINNQKLESSDIFLEGKIKDFENNLIKLRITDSRGSELLTKDIQSTSPDVNGWASFEEIVDISEITPVGNLKWQLYEENSTGTRLVWLEFETQI